MFQSVARRRQAPSKEGKPVSGNMQCIQNMYWVSSQGAQTFSTQSGGFNQVNTTPFGAPTPANPPASNLTMFSASMSGSQGQTGGFGGSFGHPQGSNTFGSSDNQGLSDPFGRGGFGKQVQVSPMQQEPGPFSAPAQGVFGQPQMQQSNSVLVQQPFGQQSHHIPAGSGAFGQVSQARSTTPFGGGFAQTTSFPGTTSDQQPVEISDQDREIWGKPSFSKGAIPEQPPPPALC